MLDNEYKHTIFNSSNLQTGRLYCVNVGTAAYRKMYLTKVRAIFECYLKQFVGICNNKKFEFGPPQLCILPYMCDNARNTKYYKTLMLMWCGSTIRDVDNFIVHYF